MDDGGESEGGEDSDSSIISDNVAQLMEKQDAKPNDKQTLDPVQSLTPSKR